MNKTIFINLLIIILLGACNTSDTSSEKKQLTNSTAQTTTSEGANLPFATKFKQLKAKYRPYEVQMPKNWHIKESYKSGAIKASSKFKKDRPNQYQETAYVNPLNRGTVIYNKDTGSMDQQDANLEDFFKEHLINLEKTLTDFKLIEQGDVKLNGLAAKRIVYQYTDKEEYHLPLQELTYFVAKGAEVYMVGGSDAAEDFEKQLSVFEGIAKTFKFVK